MRKAYGLLTETQRLYAKERALFLDKRMGVLVRIGTGLCYVVLPDGSTFLDIRKPERKYRDPEIDIRVF
jgi:hypothetical protein